MLRVFSYNLDNIPLRLQPVLNRSDQTGSSPFYRGKEESALQNRPISMIFDIQHTLFEHITCLQFQFQSFKYNRDILRNVAAKKLERTIIAIRNMFFFCIFVGWSICLFVCLLGLCFMTYFWTLSIESRNH